MIKNKSLFIILLFLLMPTNLSKANNGKSFFDFSVNLIDGKKLELNNLSGNVILLVNTASYCGFTKQYDDLQKLWDTYKERKLIVLGVPSNSFNQEKKKNNDVKKFCEVNFNINFPMTEITSVKGDDAHEIYKWAKESYGNSANPKWNFHKILIDKNGQIVDTFAPFTKPMSNKIVKAINKLIS
tara:strand:+ start:633 stop:1184 length:552 start_codon:yes stop_codon:yes gene_type:complete